MSKMFLVSEEELGEALDAAYMEGLRDNRPSSHALKTEASCRAREVVAVGVETIPYEGTFDTYRAVREAGNE